MSGLTPEQAVDRLEELHTQACESLRAALARFTATGAAPRAEAIPFTWRAWAKSQSPGRYCTTVTQPAFFRRYLLEQLRPLVDEFGATIEVGLSAQEIPYPFVTEAGDEFIHRDLSVAELARFFPTPMLANVGDEIADGPFRLEEGKPRPLALFDAMRVDFSLRRLLHYTGTDWRTIQPWILFTNYQRYVDQFLAWAIDELARP